MTTAELVAVAAATAGLIVVSWRFLRGAARLFNKTVHFLDDVNGEPARPGVPRRPGLVEQVAQIRQNQARIETVALQAAHDVQETLAELTADAGGESVKEAAYTAAAAATSTQEMMRRHLVNGEEIMAVGVHNDAQLFKALGDHGIEVTDLRDYPPVDRGDL
jgi:hypothetical protein